MSDCEREGGPRIGFGQDKQRCSSFCSPVCIFWELFGRGTLWFRAFIICNHASFIPFSLFVALRAWFLVFCDRNGDVGSEGHSVVFKLGGISVVLTVFFCERGLCRLRWACCPIRCFIALGYAVKFCWRGDGER